MEQVIDHPGHARWQVLNLTETDSARKRRLETQLRRDVEAEKLAVKAANSKDAKDKAKAKLTRRSDHADPFVYGPDMYYGGFGVGRGGSALPYWGVAAGAGLGVGMVGGYAAWGLVDADPHCMNGVGMGRGKCGGSSCLFFDA